MIVRILQQRHTPVSRTDLGVPLGAGLAERRPGVREIRISYGGGGFYNCGPRTFGRGMFRRGTSPRWQTRLYSRDGKLILDLPMATEATVPQRLLP